MSSDLALRLNGVGKHYQIRARDHDHVTAAQAALHRLRHPRGGRSTGEFWALQDIDLEIPQGQVLGIIGHNGAGKSTLLKLLSRITPPSAGRIDVFGRIGSLLEVGTGFHPELTGRENIFLNGSILGMRRREIARQFDAIVEFSGVAPFLDTPVKRYSSGMYVRLAFSVAAHLDTEILLLDEVLAVGDSEFQRKCLGKMDEVAHDGRTVLLVSHNIASVVALCRNAILLDRGRLAAQGTATDVASAYEARIATTMSEAVDLADKLHFGDPASVREVTLKRLRFPTPTATYDEGSPIELDIEVEAHRPVSVNFGVGLIGTDQAPAAVGFSAQIAVEPGHQWVRFRTPPLTIVPGDYRMSVSCGYGSPEAGSTRDIDGVAEAAFIRIANTPGGAFNWSRVWGWNRLNGCTVEALLDAPTRSST